MTDLPDDDFSPWRDDFDNGGDAPVYASPGEVTPVNYACAVCGESNSTLVDLSGGLHQRYVEDCAVCCRPNVITVDVEPESWLVTLGVEAE